MNNNLFLLFFLCSFGLIQAQEKQPLPLKKAVEKAWENSQQSHIAKEKVNAAKQALQIAKNKQYPDAGVSGQFLYLTQPDLKIKFNTTPPDDAGTEGEQGETAMPKPHYLMLGQATISLPVFSGFKIKNAVKAGQNNYRAAQFSHRNSKGDIAMQTIQYYVALYKARQAVKLVKQNLKTAQQRVRDFSNLEKNGLLARNDLLKVKLQESDVKLTLARAKKNAQIINYRLVVFLQLPRDSRITIDTLSFGLVRKHPLKDLEISRADIKALQYREKAAENTVKIKKGNYYPSLALTAGYLAADIENTLTVTNAFNVGVGISYNLSDIFKNKSSVRLAKSQLKQAQLNLAKAQDQVSIAVKNAQKEYQLALDNYQVYQKSVEEAKENYRIVKDKFENGLLETRDLLEADTRRLQSEIDLANGRADITKKYYQLIKTEGKLTDEFSNN